MSFALNWQRCKEATDAALDIRLPSASEPPQKLHEAMRYVTLNGGKRFRANLVIMTGEMLGIETQPLLAPAAAIECMHAYTLVHDDLPCMDDDDYRRGKPSCHVAFDEATAILVGDALQALAFEILSNDQDLINFHNRKGDLVAVLAQASGSRGIVGGQLMDIDFEKSGVIIEHLEEVHRMKTAKLIQCSVRLGALLCEDMDRQEYDSLSRYGESLGLAFQYKDDHLDDEHQEGQVMQLAEHQRDLAISSLRNINRDTTSLEEIARLVVDRKS